MRNSTSGDVVKLARFVEADDDVAETSVPSGETLWSPQHVPTPRPAEPTSLAPLKLSDFDDPAPPVRRRIGA
ncbi:MAG: hypothetical protein AAGK78_06870 [Planctomycetota bacterium]